MTVRTYRVFLAMSAEAKESITAAERMRHHRTRRRNGLRCLRVVLHDTEIDSLVEKGFLRPERRQDPAAIQSAIDGFICHALGPADEEQN
jgi:hypothetical protein